MRPKQLLPFGKLMTDKVITYRERQTLEALFRLSGNLPSGVVTVRQLTEATGYTRRTIFYHLKKFRTQGLIHTEGRQDGVGFQLPSMHTFSSLALHGDQVVTNDPTTIDLETLQAALQSPVRKERDKAALLFYREQRKRSKGAFGGRKKALRKSPADRLREAEEMAWQCQCDPDNWLPDEKKLCGEKFDRYLKRAQTLMLFWKWLVEDEQVVHVGKWKNARSLHIKQAIRLVKWADEAIDPADGLKQIPVQAYVAAIFIGLRYQFEQGWIDGTVPIPSAVFLRSTWCQRVYLVHKDEAEQMLARRKIRLWAKDSGTEYQEYVRDYIKPRQDTRLYDQSRHHYINNLAPVKGQQAYHICAEVNGVLKQSDLCPTCPFFRTCQTETLRLMPWQVLFSFGHITMQEAVQLHRGYHKDSTAGLAEAERLIAEGRTGKDFYVHWRLWP